MHAGRFKFRCPLICIENEYICFTPGSQFLPYWANYENKNIIFFIPIFSYFAYMHNFCQPRAEEMSNGHSAYFFLVFFITLKSFMYRGKLQNFYQKWKYFDKKKSKQRILSAIYAYVNIKNISHFTDGWSSKRL